MKILMIHPHDINHDLEPWTVRITYLAKELVLLGFEVKLIYHLFESDTDAASAIKQQDYSFETIPFHRIGPGLAKRCGEIQKLAFWADIIHFQKCSHYSAIPAIFSSFYHRKPVHYDWDDWEQAIYEQGEFSRVGSWIFFQQMEKHLLKLVDTVSVASQNLRRMTGRYGFPQDQVFYAPVGADLELFNPAVDGEEIRRQNNWGRNLVLYHGQISVANYVHLFLRAAERILSHRNDVIFAVVGGGDRLEEAKNLSNKLGITNQVTFTGKVPHADVPKYIAAADVTVACFEDNPQSRCKSPLKLVEYMASGKAIVASDMGEVPGMMGNCGLLVEAGSPDNIAQEVETCIDDASLRAQMGERARRRAEQVFSWKKSCQSLAEAYELAYFVRHGRTF